MNWEGEVRTIKERCSICNGDGWIPEPQPIEYPEGIDWELRQVECYGCEGKGYNEIEVDEKGMPK